MILQTPIIRRNADGQQNLRDLRKLLSESRHRVYKQGGNWITMQWSDMHYCYLEKPCPYHYGERQAIQWLLFGASESPDEAKYRGRKRG
jgi:hypothetical protein